MDTTTTTIVVALISAIVPATLVWLYKKRVDKADVADKLTDIAIELLEPLKKRIDEQQNEIDVLRSKVKELLKGINILVKQLRDCSIEPNWKPANGSLNHIITIDKSGRKPK